VKPTLHPYQETAVRWILDKPHCALFLDMGLGKTLATLTALERMGKAERGKTLIVAPLPVAKNTWGAEINKWGIDLTYELVLGSALERRAALKRDADLHIINRENIPWLVKSYGKHFPFETVVLDELSSFKNNTSVRFKAMRAVRPRLQRVIGLTGTPAPNGLPDLWAQVYLLDLGQRLMKFVTHYRNYYFTQNHYTRRYELRPGSEDAIYAKIEDIALSMRARDHLPDLPERVENCIDVHLSEEARQRYDEMAQEFILELGDSDITAANAAVLSGKLLQLAAGAVYDDDQNVQPIHDAKTESLKNVIEEANGQPVLVFYWFRHDRERIQAAVPDAVALDGADPRTIEKWNAGEIPVLLAHPQSTGHGLNLQYGGHIAVWFSLTWSLEAYQQANARLDRQGQTETVIVNHLIARGTIDERVMKVLQGKASQQDALLEAIKDIRARTTDPLLG